MSKKVLFAEDEQFLRNMLRTSLEEAGYEVTEAKDGQEAVDAMDAEQPDLILLDILMPNVDGFDVLKHMEEKGYNFPAVVLSNLGQENDVDKCKKLGAKDYIVKSDLDVDVLTKKISEYL